MVSTSIHFQRGMSLREFMDSFGTVAQCEAAVVAARWPNGFRCPRCDSSAHGMVSHGARRLFQCHGCRHQTSVTAGSLMEHTKLALTTWFLAIYLISQAKTGISSLALMRHLGVSYPSAWLMHQKINRAMAGQDDALRLQGAVQIDDAYLGGERTGGKPGRGSENKVPFVAAVSVDGKGHPRLLKLSLFSGFTSQSIETWARRCLLPGTRVCSDGLACFAGVVQAGCAHMPSVVGSTKPRDLPQFKWINTVLGNLKTTLDGTFHALDFAKYGQRYLSAFAYRFNRRFDLRGLLATCIVDVAACLPTTEAVIRQKPAAGRHDETAF